MTNAPGTVWRYLRLLLGRLVRLFASDSSDYRPLSREENRTALRGWSHATVARRQHDVFRQILDRARGGDIRADLRAACDAVDATGLRHPSLTDVGCASGYYAEVFRTLCHAKPRYVGVDSSPAMIALARQAYPEDIFVVGDATSLPLADRSCDILLSGTVLMHVADVAAAIAESVRVSRMWCIFHTVPVTSGASVFVSKRAYGERVAEWIFSRRELEERLQACGLDLVAEFQSVDYVPPRDIARDVKAVTYLCRKHLVA